MLEAVVAIGLLVVVVCIVIPLVRVLKAVLSTASTHVVRFNRTALREAVQEDRDALVAYYEQYPTGITVGERTAYSYEEAYELRLSLKGKELMEYAAIFKRKNTTATTVADSSSAVSATTANSSAESTAANNSSNAWIVDENTETTYSDWY